MITVFVVDKMSAYISGGMKPETAARFTIGELGAIYRGRHYSRDNSGVMRLTPPPEDIPIKAAKIKCNEAINEILDYCKKRNGKEEDKAPENMLSTQNKYSLSGFEKMAEYARNPA